jgi:hypothetical protein
VTVFAKSTGLLVDAEGDVAEGAEVEPGGRDDDVRLEDLAGGQPDPRLGELLDRVGGHRRLALPVRGEQVAVRQHGDPLLPGPIPRVEVLVDVVARGQLRAHSLDEQRPQLLGGLEGHPGELVELGDVRPAEDLVGPLLGDVERPQRVRQLVGARAGEEERRRPLQHRHVGGVGRDRRDERGRRGARADDHHALAGEVEVLGPGLRGQRPPLRTAASSS